MRDRCRRMFGCKQLVFDRCGRGAERGVLGSRNGIGDLLLQRRDLDHPCSGRLMRGNGYGRWVQLFRWFLDL